MTPTSPDDASAKSKQGADAAPAGLENTTPIALVARIAERLPELSRGELDALADAVEALTDAIGLRMDWTGE